MWGQLTSLGQVLKEQAETAAREAGLDRQLVRLDQFPCALIELQSHICRHALINITANLLAMCAGSSLQSSRNSAR